MQVASPVLCLHGPQVGRVHGLFVSGWSNGRRPNDLRLWTDRNAVCIVSFPLIPLAEEVII
jgi:hypothetical protein